MDRGWTGVGPGTRKTQTKRRKIVKRVKNRLQLTQATFLGRNCGQRRLFSSIFWAFFDLFLETQFLVKNRPFCLRQKTRFFTIFFNFFCILWYLEGEFRPTVPRYIILGVGFARKCPGNGRMLKKMKNGQNFTRESDPLGILCRRVKKTRLLAKNSPKTRLFLGGEFWRVFFFG